MPITTIERGQWTLRFNQTGFALFWGEWPERKTFQIVWGDTLPLRIVYGSTLNRRVLRWRK